jgi:hypothetical protein
MEHPARLSLRSLLVITSFLAIGCSSLVVPSVAWTIPLTAFALCLNAYGIQRAITSPEKRPFWVSFHCGVVFLFVYWFWVREVIGIDPYTDYITGPLWTRMHLDKPDNAFAPNLLPYYSFQLSLNLMFAVALPAIAAYAMQFCCRSRQDA